MSATLHSVTIGPQSARLIFQRPRGHIPRNSCNECSRPEQRTDRGSNSGIGVLKGRTDTRYITALSSACGGSCRSHRCRSPHHNSCSCWCTASSRLRLWLLSDCRGEGSPDVGLLGRRVARDRGDGDSCARRRSPKAWCLSLCHQRSPGWPCASIGISRDVPRTKFMAAS